MLTLLRKIRRSLIESQSARKYILYATGEIVLVVIGILIALQINNWNEWRKDRIKETEILSALKEDFETNLSRMDWHKNSCDTKVKIFRSILNYANLTKFPVSQEVKDTILATGNPYLEIVDVTVNSILASDNIKLLSDDTLKKLLIFYPSKIEKFKKYEDRLFHIVDNRLRNTQEKFISITELAYSRTGERITNIPSDFKGLLQDRQYFNDVTNAMWSTMVLGRMSESLWQETKRILELIDLELGNKMGL